MPYPRSGVAFLVAVPLCLAGCQTNEQTGGLVGAGGGALFGGLLGHAIGNNTTGTLIGAALGAAGGYFIGSAIGRQLDEQDRQRALAATQEALAEPAYYPPNGGQPRPPARSAPWTSNHDTGARGSATVVAVQREASGGECRTVREVAYIKGEQVVQNSRYCRSTDGGWVAQT